MAKLRQRSARELQPGRVHPVAVAELDERGYLIHGHVVLDEVRGFTCEVSGVVREGFGRVAILPAALIFESLRQIPVIEGAEGLDASGVEGIGKLPVVVDTLPVGLARAVREDA